jgi:hypothetical protein
MSIETRHFPYVLHMQRVGHPETSESFRTREEMEVRVRLITRKHFIGNMRPMYWNGSAWEMDTALLDLISHVGGSSQREMLKQAAKLFNLIAKNDVGNLTVSEKAEISECVTNLLQALDLYEPVEEDTATESRVQQHLDDWAARQGAEWSPEKQTTDQGLYI